MILIYKKKINKNSVKELIEQIKEKQKPIKKKKNQNLYIYKNLVIKQFTYKSKLNLFLRFKGLQCYLISYFLILKNISIPKPIFYFQKETSEFFASEKIEGVEILEYLKKKRNYQELNNFKIKFIDFINELFSKKIYHSDFDATNILIDKKNKFYLIDIESIIPFLVNSKKEKMLRKLNRLLIKNFGFELSCEK